MLAHGGLIHKPVTWNRAAAAFWSAGRTEEAIRLCLEALDANPDADADAFIQPGVYLFQTERFDVGSQVFERAMAKFPDHPMILLSLGSTYSRWRKHDKAIPILERFLKHGIADATAFDALAMSCSSIGDTTRARLFGSMALTEKDALTKDRHGTPELHLSGDFASRRKIIAFTLFGSDPRYLRGALQNVLVARTLYPCWTCRFYVDDSVDATFLKVMTEEGAETIHDESGDHDIRHRLCRRFLVSDDPEVGLFIVRDCDSVVSEREAAAVAEWLGSGEPFHVMRDWYTHTDPMLAGLWGGTAGMFPDMAGAIEQYRTDVPLNSNWDQFFLRNRVWPAIRDHVMVHDRCFDAHRAQPFPTPTPSGSIHVGQNEHATEVLTQAEALKDYAERIPALALPRPVKLQFKTS